MTKIFLTIVTILSFAVAAAQPVTREELEKQQQQLKKELEQTQKMLNDNKSKSKENYVQWKLANDKVNLQDRLIDNINRDINLLDNNLYNTQRDINRYNKLLDTLKQEYAKSMVYAYKNRSNYDFLNFIFSAASFNDAVKRITYLKSYRDYREMQGQNILRTQDLRKKRIEELTGTKELKNVVLISKDKEMATLENEKKEKDRILNELKKQGKQLSDKMIATKKQFAKVNNAITAAIKRATDAAKKKAASDAAAAKASTAKLAKAEKDAKEKLKAGSVNVKIPVIKSDNAIIKETVKEKTKSVLITEENLVLNQNFIKNRGALPWPAQGYLLMHYGRNQLPNGIDISTTGITIATEVGATVKVVFDGTVSNIIYVDDIQVVIVQHGEYFSTYSNLSSVSVQKGQTIKTGQTIGKAAANLDGVGAVDFYINDEKNNLDPEKWIRRK